MPWLKKGLFHSLKMHLLPLWVFLQTEMTDFPIPFHILYRGGRVLWNVGCVCVCGGDHVPLSHKHTGPYSNFPKCHWH